MNELSPKAEVKDMEFVSTKSVLIAVRVHPFPSRTRQLSSLAPKILGWRRPGKIGSADTNRVWSYPDQTLSIFLLSSVGRACGC